MKQEAREQALISSAFSGTMQRACNGAQVVASVLAELLVAKKIKKDQARVVGLFGIGLDNDDGHRRITRSEEFILVGGSQETHERMQDVAIRFSEALQERGRALPYASVDEVIDLLREAADR